MERNNKQANAQSLISHLQDLIKFDCIITTPVKIPRPVLLNHVKERKPETKQEKLGDSCFMEVGFHSQPLSVQQSTEYRLRESMFRNAATGQKSIEDTIIDFSQVYEYHMKGNVKEIELNLANLTANLMDYTAKLYHVKDAAIKNFSDNLEA